MGLGLTAKKKKTTASSSTTPQTTAPQTTAPQTTAPAVAPSTTTPQSSAMSGTVPSGFKGSATGVTTYNQGQSDILSQMNANSQAWHTADEAGKASLAAKNQALAQLLGGNVTFDSSTGYWSGAAEAPVETGEKPTFDYSEYDSSKPSYTSQYNNKIDQLLNQILNREDFSYNAESDPLYQQYREQYRREGDRARENTLADIASSAGGMNSWAVTAAQQAQNNYNAQLGDKIPELYQLAYQMYLNDKASQVEDLGLLQQMDSTQYNRYRDTMSDWRDDRDFAYGAYRDDMGDYQWGTNFNYGVSQDQINNAWKDKEWDYGVSTDQYNREQAENETAYNREQAEQQNARAWALDLIASGVTPDSATLQQAGLTLDQAKQILANEQAAAAKKPSSSKTGGGGGGTEDDTTGNATDGLKGIREKASSFKNNNELDNYLIGLVESGAITEQQALALSAEFTDQSEKYVDAGDGTYSYSYKDMVNSTAGWTVQNDGGINWFGGVDNNAILEAPTGETFRADNLVEKLVEEGMSEKEAKAAVAKLQKNLDS